MSTDKQLRENDFEEEDGINDVVNCVSGGDGEDFSCYFKSFEDETLIDILQKENCIEFMLHNADLFLAGMVSELISLSLLDVLYLFAQLLELKYKIKHLLNFHFIRLIL